MRQVLQGAKRLPSPMESYEFEVNCFLHKFEARMSRNPVSLTSGSLSIPNSEILCNENDFGVVQSPHQESYMIGNSRQNTLMEPWEKSSIKPIEIFTNTPNLPEFPQPPEVPDVVVTESSSQEVSTLSKLRQMSLPKMPQIYDEYHEEMFQLDDETDDLGPEPLTFSALKNRKMSRSTDDLNPKNEISTTQESASHKQLQKFRSDSNLHSGESNMSLVEKVTMLNLTAAKKDVKSSPSPLRRENSEEQLIEGDGALKRWFLQKPVAVSHREMNAIAPFSS